MDVCPLLIATSQSPKLVELSKASLHHPPPVPQSTAMIGISLREPRDNATATETAPDRLGVITTVAQNTIRTMARAPALSLKEWDGINECEGLLRIVAIGACELDGERNTTTVADQMALAAQLRSVSRIRSCPPPPKTARTEQLSTTARDHSIRP
jgi:hypothetical protein